MTQPFRLTHLILIAFCILFAALLIIPRRDVIVNTKVARVGASEQVLADSIAEREPLSTVRNTDVELNDLVSMDFGNATIEDLGRKGFPLISPPRQAAVETTASQTIEEVVRDLGNLYSIGMSSLHTVSGNYGLHDIGRWQAMSRHVKVLRVIEEGRQNPKHIAALLNDAIENALTSLEEVQSEAVFEMARMASGESIAVVTERDEFLQKEHRYENAALEIERRYELAHAGFFALANINELSSPSLLAEWISLSRVPMFTPKDMHVWLIDQYFEQGGSGSAEAQTHSRLAAGIGFESLGSVQRSRWNAPWDLDHPLLKAKDVDMSGIPTIDVLRIPTSVDADEATKDAIIDNFLQHARRLRD
jgi:hypothetical protein